MKFKLFSIFIAISIIAVSCKKDKEETTNTNNNNSTPTPVASITIHSPIAGTTIEHMDTVEIDVHIDADFEMHGYDAYLINETADDTVWTASLHDHANSYEVTGEWINVVTDHSDMKLKVVAEIDHDGNTTEKEIEFHCHPM